MWPGPTMAQLHVFLSLLLLCVGVNAQLNTSQIIEALPKCALNCIFDGLQNSSCSVTDLRCTCSNTSLQKSLSECVQGACNFTAQQQVGTLNMQLCAGENIPDHHMEIVIPGIVFGVVTLPIVGLRCHSRYKIARRLWWDDWTILAASVILAGIIALDITNGFLGFGRHLWNIPPTRTSTLLKLFVTSEILYIAIIAFTKASILFFYLRVFQSRTFRFFCWASIAFIFLWAIPFILVILFQCSPINAIWDRTVDGKCLSVNAIAISSAGISIGQDFLVLLMPITQLRGLHMSTKKKLNVLFMFSLGAIGTVTSIIRLRFIISFGASKDPTWDDVVPSIWSLAEINIAMICACLPAIRALLSMWLPSIFDISQQRKSAQSSQNSNKFNGRWNNVKVYLEKDKFDGKVDANDLNASGDFEMPDVEANPGSEISHHEIKSLPLEPSSDIAEARSKEPRGEISRLGIESGSEEDLWTSNTPVEVNRGQLKRAARRSENESQEDLWMTSMPTTVNEGQLKKVHIVRQLSLQGQSGSTWVRE